MPPRKFTVPEMNDLHHSKILLCYLMNKLNRPVGEEQLHEIAMQSEVINHFYYSEALEELIRTGALSRCTENGICCINIEEKGRLGAEYFDLSVPAPFRRKILETAYSYFAEIRHSNECTCETAPAENGCVLRFSISDGNIALMKTELYAPDEEQADLIAERLKRNPSEFYRRVITALLSNPEDKPDIDIE